MNHSYITVTQLTKYIKFKIDNDPNLDQVYLKGEISNFKAHTRGHFYFTIKDENTRINAVMFSSHTSKIKFLPTDGMKVLISGKVSVYEATGGYQVYVNEMLEDGVGNLYVAFEQLKKKLEGEGLFHPSNKKPIPKIPTTIGIITAPTGAAIKDILSTIKRRWPLAKTILFPSLVQGEEAAKDIVKNINLSKRYDLDVLIVGRGGGSIEDLWPFNEEIVARAIYELDTPVISAVGHEIDYTISDFVADLRAPTPTGAAEMAVPNIKDVTSYLEQLNLRLMTNLFNIVQRKKEALTKLENSFVLKNPLTIYEVKEQKFDGLYERLLISYKNLVHNNNSKLLLIHNNLTNSMCNLLNNHTNHYNHLLDKLNTLNPLLTLKRGYSIVKIDNKIVDSMKKIKKNDIIDIEMQDGNVSAKII